MGVHKKRRRSDGSHSKSIPKVKVEDMHDRTATRLLCAVGLRYALHGGQCG